MKSRLLTCALLALLSAPLLAEKGKVESFTGDVVVTQNKFWLVVAVDTDKDGTVDRGFGYQLQQEKGGKRPALKESVRLTDATLEYWGDRMIVTSEARAFGLELAIVGSSMPQREFPSGYRVIRLTDGYGLATRAPKKGSSADGGGLSDYEGGFKKADEGEGGGEGDEDGGSDCQYWWFCGGDDGGGGGERRPVCQAGGRGSYSCEITCGADPIQGSASVTCGGSSYACCWCDFTRAFAQCRAYGP